MLFSSVIFILFFLPLVLLLYYYCPATKGRNYILLFASLLFYGWGEPGYIIVMLASILLNYRIALLISTPPLHTHSSNTARLWLFPGIALNVLILFYFKYFWFSIEKYINPVLSLLSKPELSVREIALPLGISFYTFQAISYLVDVYKNPSMVQKNILDMGLYITFFPQLVAGPIVRYHDINQQIACRTHSIDAFAGGIKRFITGLSKKVLLANSLGEIADHIFVLPSVSVPAPVLWIAILAYTLQIYYDFSGYSDMAIGLGRMFGFTIPENFNYPYISKSIREFWRRWHISLSTWFRDYLYIPLGGSRKGQIRTVLNLWFVFFITGLWHGPQRHFIVWGLGHGFLMFAERMFGKKLSMFLKYQALKTILGHIYALTGVLLLWVFFRLGVFESAEFIKNLFDFHKVTTLSGIGFSFFTVYRRFPIVLFFAVCFAFPWWKKITVFHNHAIFQKYGEILRYACAIALLFLSMSSLANSVYNPFLYFRF
jgi:alginate O-acetyltransferase complex protein AlgI